MPRFAPVVRRQLSEKSGRWDPYRQASPHRPGTAPALGLRARGDDRFHGTADRSGNTVPFLEGGFAMTAFQSIPQGARPFAAVLSLLVLLRSEERRGGKRGSPRGLRCGE